MADEAADPEVAAALAAAHAAIGRIQSLTLAPEDVDDAKALVGAVEALARRVGSVQLSLLTEIARSGVHRQELFASAKVFVRHHGRLSDAEAKRRDLARRALDGLPAVASSFAAGRIGWCQVGAIARVWANPRVRALLIDQEVAAAQLAERLPYLSFAGQLRRWERLVDQDGTEDKARSGHEQRNATVVADFDGNWLGTWTCGGSTSPGNGAPLCGTHNRTKEQGYRITRDPAGTLHVHRPDGTEIT